MRPHRQSTPKPIKRLVAPSPLLYTIWHIQLQLDHPGWIYTPRIGVVAATP